MFINEENVIYVMIGGSLFTFIGMMIALMIFNDIKKADLAREKARIEEIGRRNLVQSSNAFKRGHRR